MRSQSAMEYLMTYGWAILIIAIILVALFSLNLFNSYTFAPKAPPGACQVLRPNGPGSNVFVTMEGGSNCEGVLPEYVAKFIDRQDSIRVGSAGLPLTGPRSAFAWVYYTGEPSNSSGMYYSIFSYGMNGPPPGILSDLNIEADSSGSQVEFEVWGGNVAQLSIDTNSSWEFVGYSYSGGPSNTVEIYEGDRNSTTNLHYAANTQLGSAEIGMRGGPSGAQFSGMIADVQVYNTSLTPAQVNQIYLEGIGGAPIDLQNLVGWWPLNGNANDYSGNGNNGVPSGVTYTSNWESGYSSP